MDINQIFAAAIGTALATAIVTIVMLIYIDRKQRELTESEEGIEISRQEISRELHRLAKISTELDERERQVKSMQGLVNLHLALIEVEPSPEAVGVGVISRFGGYACQLFGKN